MNIMKDVIFDALVDSFKLLPFLFVTFLIIELFEHKLSSGSKKIITKSGRFGPLIGSFLGLVPQCGFSVAATNLYVTRIISLGTLIAVYLSTSDEMIPILIAEHASFGLFFKIIIIKFLIGIVFGYIIDLLFRRRVNNEDYSICDSDHCHCDSKILFASFKHTFNVFVFILICNFIISFCLEFGGMKYLETVLLKDNVFASFVTGLIGLIPNCASSVVLTELFLSNAISFGSLIAGLCSGAGVAILVLFKTNRSKRDNLFILGLVYFIGVLSGIVIDITLSVF